MDKKILKLVERVAKIMYYQHVTSGFKWENESQWFRDKYLGYAREVLNDPNLALIVDTTVWAHVKGFREIIPIAKELKKKVKPSERLDRLMGIDTSQDVFGSPKGHSV